MNNIKAIGFDLFNTLITVDPETLTKAIARLTQSLRESGFPIEDESFLKTYREKASIFIEAAKKDGRETHNSYWISAALETDGKKIPHDDVRITRAVESYFSAFYDCIRLIPGTRSMLQTIKGQYSIGLLSNFTHGPAAREILRRTGLDSYFEIILISGELGYRKPHPLVFERLTEGFQFEKEEILYIGDDPDPDVHGAYNAGLQSVWMTYVQDNNVPMTTGMIHGDQKKPEFEVPRISSWNDLLILLNLEDVP